MLEVFSRHTELTEHSRENGAMLLRCSHSPEVISTSQRQYCDTLASPPRLLKPFRKERTDDNEVVRDGSRLHCVSLVDPNASQLGRVLQCPLSLRSSTLPALWQEYTNHSVSLAIRATTKNKISEEYVRIEPKSGQRRPD